MWARLYTCDAVLIEARVEEMARSVCEDDPRTLPERRADALIALAARTDLACACGQPDCPGAGEAAPATTAVVYVVADEKSVDAAAPAHAERAAATTAATDQPDDSADDDEGDDSDDAGAPATATTSDPIGTSTACAAAPPPAFVFGGGILPTALLGAILERARIRQVRHPGGDTPPEPRYTPTRQTCEFVRCRDLTCRFPGCDKPAQVCDIDHTVPYPAGPTHPSNLKCLCGFHHLLKTFWNGVNGWRDRRLSDGTGIWTVTDRAHLHHLSGQQAPVPDSCVNPPPRCGPANHRPSTPPATAA